MKKTSESKAKPTGRMKDRISALARIPGLKIEQARARLVKIPFFGLLNDVLEGMGNDGASEMAGSIAYYAILSLFPLLLGVISVLGYFLPSATVQAQVFLYVETNLPGATDIIRQNIEGIIKVRGALGILSILGLFWSSGAMFGAISRSISRAFSATRSRPFYLNKIRDVTMSLSACVFFYLIIAAATVSSVLSARWGPIAGLGVGLLEFNLVFLVLLLIYKTVPNTKTYLGQVWTGALFAAAAFEIARIFMGLYFDRFSRLELVYGTVGSIIFLLIFIYYIAFILIMGAEISSEYSRRRRGLGPRPRVPPDMCEIPKKDARGT